MGGKIWSVLILLALAGIVQAMITPGDGGGGGGATSISSCGILSAPGTYTLTQSVSSSGTDCFNVTAPNVVLECAGYLVTGSGAVGTYGVYSNQPSTTVDNCVISGYGYPIQLDTGSNYGKLTNIKITSSTRFGITILSSSNDLLKNITITSIPQVGIALTASSGSPTITSNNNTLIDISVSSTNTGVYVWGYNNNLTNVNSTSYTYAISLVSSPNSILQNINAKSNLYNSIHIDGSPNSIITNFNSSSNSGYGVYLHNSSGSSISNGVISAGSTPLYVDGSSASNMIYNNTLISASGAGTLLYISRDSGKNIFYWNNFTATSGLYINDLNGTNLYNSTAPGQTEGNIYANVLSGAVTITGSVHSLGFPFLYLGNTGSGYPYNNANSQNKVSAVVVDYTPLTPTKTPSCPAASCSGNQRCTYSGTSCTATCSACPSGTTCTDGTCTRLPGGSPLMRKCLDPNGCNLYTEPVEQLPFGGMWAAIVVVIAVIGLGIGYFIMKSMISRTAGRRPKKK